MHPGVYYGHHTDMVNRGYSPDMVEFYPDYRYYIAIKLFDEPVLHGSFLTYEELFDKAERMAFENSIPLILVEGKK